MFIKLMAKLRSWTPRRTSLAAKLNTLSILLMIAMSAGICLALIKTEMRNYRRDLVNHGTTVADTIARNSEYGIYVEDQLSLQLVFEGLASDPDIAYAVLATRERRILTSRAFQPEMHVPTDAAMQWPELGGGDAVSDIEIDGQRYIEIISPVYMANTGGITEQLMSERGTASKKQLIGYVRLGLSSHGMRLRIQQMMQPVALISLVSVMGGIALMLLLTRRITSPLRHLTEAARDVAEGRFDTPVIVKTHDEIHDLARTFDNMRISLRDYRKTAEARTAELIAANQRLSDEVGARRAAEEQLAHDAFHDNLTGLPNRSLFMDRLKHALMRARRTKGQLISVLYLDLDRFKIINESLGHPVGDQLLIACGKRISTCLRPHDTVARLGGDEFVVLLEDIGAVSNATFIAERIGAAFVQPFRFDDQDVFITGSIGISITSLDTTYENPEQMLRDADTAMYKAKSSGKAGFAIFEPRMHAHAVERLRTETELRRAIDREEFVVYYQPIVWLETGRLVGFEGLVRWNHPVRGVLNPGDFIAMAEETGGIVAIDRVVLKEACRMMRSWQERFVGTGLEFMSVNLSNKQMMQPDLVEFVRHTLQETGLQASNLKLEITENVIVENADAMATLLNRLKELGVKLFIDDFGTGYSSLSHLHRLPVDGLKIDRSFVKRIGDRGENHKIVRTIVMLAQDMNIDVVAEGIETAAQVQQMRELACGYGQGYHYSRPVAADMATRLIEFGLNISAKTTMPLQIEK